MNDEKIKLINNLLENEEEFYKYIDKIEIKDIEVPSTLEKKINSRLINKTKTPKAATSNFLNICKIAACTAFAIIVWKVAFINFDGENSYARNEKLYVANENIKDVFSSFSDMLMKPLDIKGGEK